MFRQPLYVARRPVIHLVMCSVSHYVSAKGQLCPLFACPRASEIKAQIFWRAGPGAPSVQKKGFKCSSSQVVLHLRMAMCARYSPALVPVGRFGRGPLRQRAASAEGRIVVPQLIKRTPIPPSHPSPHTAPSLKLPSGELGRARRKRKQRAGG